nr:insulin-like growth factor-binding protein 2 [Pogona vitticeps]
MVMDAERNMLAVLNAAGFKGTECMTHKLHLVVHDTIGLESHIKPNEGICGKQMCTVADTTNRSPLPCVETEEHAEGSIADNIVDGAPSVVSGGGRLKPLKNGREMAVIRDKVNEQQKHMGKPTKHHHHPDLRAPSLRTPCQQELDQVLERISTMRLPDERGPLEHLYSLNIPNCDKQGLYNLKQCKMSVNGQRGECWCVNPNTGKTIQGAPTIRGDPECHLFYPGHEQEARGLHALRVQ